MEEWLTINFTMPKEPSRVRVSVWRKLKRSGAVNLGQSVWTLPVKDEHLDIFKEIVEEVKGNKGLAFIMKTKFIQEQNDIPIKDYFNNIRDEEYKEFLDRCDDFHKEIRKETERNNYSFAEIDENEREIEKLSTWLEEIMIRDFFKSSMREKSQNELSKCKEVLEDYCNKVYEMEGNL